MSFASLRNSVEWALLVALVLGGGALAQAQNEQAGKIVRLSPGGENIAIEEAEVDEGPITHDGTEQPELPKHWIGIMGTPVPPELRAHLDVPEGQGLLVRHVVAESPAAKAGLENFDILLRANDTDLADMRNLMEIVKTEGEKQGKITLEVLRHGKHVTLSITPEERPEKVAGVEAGEGWGSGAPGPGQEQDMFRFFDRRLGNHGAAGPGGPLQFRVFGPGTVLNGGPMNLEQMPSGVSVSIQKQEGQPAQITVERGEESWTIVGDDPGSLEQLPADVRPFVEQMLSGGGPTQIPLPAMPNIEIPNATVPPGAFHENELQQRLQKLEQHLEQLQLQLEHQHGEVHGENDTETEAE